MPFKRAVYERVVEAHSRICKEPMNQTTRPFQNVGIALFNAHGRVLIAKRFRTTGRRSSSPATNGRCRRAASTRTKTRARPRMRELWEETGVTSVE